MPISLAPSSVVHLTAKNNLADRAIFGGELPGRKFAADVLDGDRSPCRVKREPVPRGVLFQNRSRIAFAA
jgi:hypothetical protein